MKRMLLALFAFALLFPPAGALAGAGTSQGGPPSPPAPSGGTDDKPAFGPDRVVLQTGEGNIVLALYPEIAPRHVAEFLRLVRAGVYDHTAFSFIDAGYYVQVGTPEDRAAPLTAEQRKLIRPVPAETGLLSHHRGSISFTITDPKQRTSGTSFSILLEDAPHLDELSSIFGEVESGFDVLARLEHLPRNRDLQPLRRVEITRATVLPAGDAAMVAELSRAAQAQQTHQSFVLWVFLMIALLSLGAFFFKSRLSPRSLQALNLLNAGLAAFALFVIFTPTTRDRPLLAGGIFLGMIGFFKLMNRFESA